MATTDTYRVVVDSNQAQRSLKDLQSSLDKTSGMFSGLKNALAGLAIGSFVAQAYQMANALTDMAVAAGISTQSLLGFRDAVAANGGEAQGAVDGIAKFAQAIERAAEGSKGAQDSFLTLGISLNDLATLSEQDLLAKVITGLAGVGDNAKRSSIGIEFFGKSFKAVDFAGVARDIGAFTAAAGGSASAVEAAGQTSQNFSNAMLKLQTDVLVALKPISELAIRMMEAGTSINNFITTALKIAAVIGTFTLFGKAVSLVGIAFQALLRAPALIAAGISSLTTTFIRLVGQIKAIGGVTNLTSVSFSIFGTRLKFLQQGIALVASGLKPLIAAFAALYAAIAPDSFKSAVNSTFDWITDKFKSLFASEKEAADGGAQAQKDAGDKTKLALAEKAAAAQAAARQVADALAKEKASLESIVASYRSVNEEANKRYKADTEGISQSLAARTQLEESLRAESEYTKELTKLKEIYAEKSKSTSESDKLLLPSVTKAMADLTAEYQKQIGIVTELVDARMKAQAAQQLEIFNTKTQIDNENKLQQIRDNMAKMTMTEIEKKYYDIEAAANASAKAAVEAEEARRGSKLSKSEVEDYYAAAKKGSAELRKEMEKEEALSRDFSMGWKKAMKEYAYEAGNGAKKAESLFKKATQGMEDAIVGFAKTGKFEWRDFMSVMLEELLRSQIQQLFASTMSGMQESLGGLLGSISSAGSSPKGATPGITGGGSGGGGGLGDLLGGAWDAVSGLFDGFFANGGTIGAGKFGIVGEAGAEIVAGPATVTPNSALGGTTNVYYTINAVDTTSFRNLLASDPGYLYAVTMAGAGSVPARR